MLKFFWFPRNADAWFSSYVVPRGVSKKLVNFLASWLSSCMSLLKDAYRPARTPLMSTFIFEKLRGMVPPTDEASETVK